MESQASLLLSGIAIVATLGVAYWKYRTDRYFRIWQKKTTEEAVDVQLRFLAIEEARHERELATWDMETIGTDTPPSVTSVLEDLEPEPSEAPPAVRDVLAAMSSRSEFSVSFAWRDSARTWARLIARNDGPADARDVKLDVWGDSGGERREVGRISGMDRGESDRLQPREAVHIAFAFTFGSPGPEDLHYRLTWTDGAGTHEEERQVPML